MVLMTLTLASRRDHGNSAVMADTPADRHVPHREPEMADSVSVSCPNCSVKLKLPGNAAGKKVKCPKCATPFRIGGTTPPTTAVPPAVPQKKKKRAASSESPEATPRRKKRATSSGTTAGADSAANPKRKKTANKKREKKRKPVDEYDDFADDFASEGDDFGGAFDDDFGDGGFDDGYDDPYGASSGPSTRKKSKKKKKKAKSKSSGGGLQATLHKLGFLGWLISGGLVAAVCVVATTLLGYVEVSILISIMSLVTGTAIGGAIRFVATPTQGWGPGLTSAGIAICAIMLGKIGAFYIWSDAIFDDVGGGDLTVQEAMNLEATDSAMIAEIADDVEFEWMQSGEITNEEIEDWWEQTDEDYEDYESPVDHSGNYLPQVWAEAEKRWKALPEDERNSRLEAARQRVREDYGVEAEDGADGENPDADDDQLQEDVDKAVESVRLPIVIIFAIGNIFFPLYSLFFFCSGMYGSFKLASNLGDDT